MAHFSTTKLILADSKGQEVCLAARWQHTKLHLHSSLKPWYWPAKSIGSQSNTTFWTVGMPDIPTGTNTGCCYCALAALVDHRLQRTHRFPCNPSSPATLGEWNWTLRRARKGYINGVGRPLKPEREKFNRASGWQATELCCPILVEDRQRDL